MSDPFEPDPDRSADDRIRRTPDDSTDQPARRSRNDRSERGDEDSRRRRVRGIQAEEKSNTLLIVLGVVGVVLLGCCGGVSYVGYRVYRAGSELVAAGGAILEEFSGVTTCQNDFVRALSNNPDTAYAMTSKSFKQKYPTAKEFKDFIEKNKDLKNPLLNPNIQIGSGGQPSTVSGVMGTKNVTLTIVKEGEQFKVDDLEIY